MLSTRSFVTVACACIGLGWTPAFAESPHGPVPIHNQTRLSGLSAEEAAELIERLGAAQQALRRNAPVNFELLSGAPASYPMVRTSPRDAFLAVDFTDPFGVERLPPLNSNRNPYRLTLLPNGPGNLLWDVEVVLDGAGAIARVEMLYRPPHPF